MHRIVSMLMCALAILLGTLLYPLVLLLFALLALLYPIGRRILTGGSSSPRVPPQRSGV
jgi:hypothetical protein